jgi:hypothetical protein
VRIPFPERVPLDRVAVFAVVLFVIQWYDKTDNYFSAGCAAFIKIVAVGLPSLSYSARAIMSQWSCL